MFWSGDRERLVDELAAAAPTMCRRSRGCSRRSARACSSARAARRVVRGAVSAGDRVARCGATVAARAMADRLRHGVADRLVLAKVRAAFGPHNPVVLTGAAPIGPEVLEFFDACGITVLEGYGMTETAAASTLNTRAEQRARQRRAAAAAGPRSRSPTTARS